MQRSRTLWLILVALGCCLPARAADEMPLVLNASKTFSRVVASDGRFLTIVFEGLGEMRRVGRVSAVGQEILDLQTGNQVLDLVITGQCGDQFRLHMVGAFTNEDDAAGTFEVVGGRGIFANATGSGTFVALDQAETVTLEGTISKLVKGKKKKQGR